MVKFAGLLLGPKGQQFSVRRQDDGARFVRCLEDGRWVAVGWVPPAEAVLLPHKGSMKPEEAPFRLIEALVATLAFGRPADGWKNQANVDF